MRSHDYRHVHVIVDVFAVTSSIQSTDKNKFISVLVAPKIKGTEQVYTIEIKDMEFRVR